MLAGTQAVHEIARELRVSRLHLFYQCASFPGERQCARACHWDRSYGQSIRVCADSNPSDQIGLQYPQGGADVHLATPRVRIDQGEN